MITCPSCGTENPEGQKFCGECGTKLGTPALAEERKVVTIVFCDLVGFTQRSETLDPEDVRSFLLPYYDLMTEEVRRHGGVIDKFLGDGVMAVFGAPVAHEDDPERAVRAALKVIERVPSLGLDLHVRVGINTGEVVVAAGAFERGDAITGGAANTASRLQSAAPLDGVVVGERTHEVTSHLFDYETLDPVTVKGKSEPLPIFRPLAPIARLSSELVDDATPFVGRDFELDSLIRLFDRVRTGPSTEFVTIVAEPGIGKSRLVREFARHVEGLPELVTWRQGRCLPYGDGISFWALGEIIKAHAGILDTDDQATLGSKLDQVLTEPDEQLLAWMKVQLGPLVGVETTGGTTQEESFTAWRRFLEQIAERGPTVLVVEDLHWADDALVRFLQHLAKRTLGLPLLVVLTARPEVEERHPSWLGRARRSTVLPLAALADEDMSALVDSTLEGASAEVVATVLERAGGSPLYAEQLAAMLKDRPFPIAGGSLGQTTIPPTIQALLTARIDRLPTELKGLLLDASVLGKTFWGGAVAALASRPPAEVDAALADLARREFIRPVFPSSMQGEQEFAFWHALVRDVAYQLIPRMARVNRHVGAASWIESKAADRLEDLSEILAHHYTSARAIAIAAGGEGEAAELADPARRFLTLAGRRALELDAEASMEVFERAVELAPPGHPERPEILSLLGYAAALSARFTEAAEALEEAAETFRSRGDHVGAARAIGRLLLVRQNLNQPGQLEAAAEALELLESRPPSEELVRAVCGVSEQSSFEGRPEEGLALAERALVLSEALGLSREPGLFARAIARGTLGDPRGLEDDREALALAIGAGRGRGAASVYYNLAADLFFFEGPRAAVEAFREGADFASARGLGEIVLSFRGAVLGPMLDTGELETILELAPGVRRDAEAVHHDFAAMMALSVELVAGALLGETSPDPEVLARMRSSARRTGRVDAAVQPLSAVAVVSAFLGDHEVVTQALREIEDLPGIEAAPDLAPVLPALTRAAIGVGDVEVASRLTSLLIAPFPYASHAVVAATAALAEARGDREGAIAMHEDAAERWSSFGVVTEEAFALHGLGRCLLAVGRTEEGVARLTESRELWVAMRATPRIAEIDELLATVG